MNLRYLIASFSLFALLSTAAEARLYKWVDERGVTHYGETIPPEYAGNNPQRLEKGQVKTRDGFSERLRATSTEDSATQTARRRDQALLNTYSNETEIDLARDRNLLQVEARINSYTIMLRNAEDAHANLLKEQNKIVERGREIPPSLTEDIAQAKARMTKLQADLSQNTKERDAVKARYTADKLRFRELKGITPQSNNSPEAQK